MTSFLLFSGGAAASGRRAGGDPRVADRIVPAGMIFRYPDGAPHRVKRTSSFRLGQRLVLFGEDMAPHAEEQTAVGANSVRVFCQYATGIGNDGRILRPEDFTPDRILALTRWLLARSLRCELTILADCEQLGMDHAAQVRRVAAVLAAVAGEPNVMVELGNEPGANGCDVDRIARELGLTDPAKRPVPICTGNYDYSSPATLVLDYFNNHLERKEGWAAEAGKEGHFMYDGWDADSNGPAWKGCKPAVPLSDEPIGCIELVGTPNYGRRDNRPFAFEDGGAGFGVGGGGACFHSDAGVQSARFGPITRACAEAFFAAMDFFAADAPTGKYTHDGLDDHPLASTAGRSSDEVVARVFDTRAYVVAANPYPGYVPRPLGNWRIVAEHGTRRNILVLER